MIYSFLHTNMYHAHLHVVVPPCRQPYEHQQLACFPVIKLIVSHCKSLQVIASHRSHPQHPSTHLKRKLVGCKAQGGVHLRIDDLLASRLVPTRLQRLRGDGMFVKQGVDVRMDGSFNTGCMCVWMAVLLWDYMRMVVNG